MDFIEACIIGTSCFVGGALVNMAAEHMHRKEFAQDTITVGDTTTPSGRPTQQTIVVRREKGTGFFKIFFAIFLAILAICTAPIWFPALVVISLALGAAFIH